MVDGRHKMKKTLPFSLIASEILSRVPAKSDIGRCRCVCKEWKSFLSTPMFHRMHLRYHVSIDDYKVLLFDGVPPVRLPLNETIPIPNPNPNPNPNPGVRILASLDGLVCLASREVPATLVFWNPLTGAYKKLSSIPRIIPKVFARDPIGFYIDSSNDYKLVCLASGGLCGAYVYSHRLDSWREIELSVVRPKDLGRWSLVGTFCGRCVYFAVRVYMESHGCIICFDVETETFRKIRYPPIPAGATEDGCGSLVVLNGCLHLCVSYKTILFNNNNINDYSLKKHGDLWRMDDGDEWVKVGDSGGQQQQRFICTASTGNWVAVLDEDDNSFKKLNTEDFTTHYRYFSSASMEYRSSRIIFVETLVSP